MNGLRIAVPIVVAVAAGAILTPAALRQTSSPVSEHVAPPPPPPPPLTTRAPASSPPTTRDHADLAFDDELPIAAEAIEAAPAVRAPDEIATAVARDSAAVRPANPTAAPAPTEQTLSAFLGGLESSPGNEERSIKVGDREQLTLLVSATQTTNWLVQHYARTIAAVASAPSPEEANATGRTNDTLWLPAANPWLQVTLDCGDEARLRCTAKAGHPETQELKRGAAPNVWRWDIEALPHDTTQRQRAQTISAVIMAGPTAEGPFQRIGQMPDQRLMVQIETASWIEQLLKRGTGVLTAISTFLAALLAVVLAIRRFRRKALEAAEADDAGPAAPPEAPVAP